MQMHHTAADTAGTVVGGVGGVTVVGGVGDGSSPIPHPQPNISSNINLKESMTATKLQNYATDNISFDRIHIYTIIYGSLVAFEFFWNISYTNVSQLSTKT